LKTLSLEDPRWLGFVESRPDATLFHHPAWARLLADCYGYRAMAIALTASDGTVTAGLPVIDVSRPLGRRRWVSLPFTDRCAALAAASTDELATALVDLTRSKKLDALEVRAPLAEHADVQHASAFVWHELPLANDTTPTWERLFKNHRRNVRIAERSGVRIVAGDPARELEVFYRLHVRTRRRLGVPTQPRRFFDLLLDRVLRPGLGFVLSAYAGDTPVAAAVFGCWNGTAIYKYSARDERFAKLDANYLLLWTAIQTASQRGCHTFDLGRSDTDQVDLRGFKNGWGAREEPLTYSWVATAPVSLSSGTATRALSVVIRNSAPWVGRALGELFYKYAA
jgi:CelD/BcsL family acetyltransferase involved in cellulose biosynthesis